MHTYTMVFMWVLYAMCIMGALVWTCVVMHYLNAWVFTPVCEWVAMRRTRARAMDRALCAVLRDMGS